MVSYCEDLSYYRVMDNNLSVDLFPPSQDDWVKYFYSQPQSDIVSNNIYINTMDCAACQFVCIADRDDRVCRHG